MDFSFFALLVIFVGSMVRLDRLLGAQLLFCVLGTASAVSLPALGGASVTAPWLFSLFLIGRAWLARPRARPPMRLSRASLWISLVAAWGATSSYYLPRWLAGTVFILTIDRANAHAGPTLMPLQPVSGNITQSAYAIGGALAFVAMRSLIMRSETGLSSFRDAVLLLAAVNAACGVLNLGEFYAGVPPVLQYVRTGAYRIFESYESAGLLRIQGTFAETAAFSAFTLPLFVFAAQLWLRGERTRYSAWAAALSLALLLASTSATAYASLFGYLGLLACAVGWQAVRNGTVPRALPLFTCTLVVLCAAGLVYGLELKIGRTIARFVELTLLNKLQSPSGIERSSWNAHAWANFVDTYGLGVGLGGARASSFVLVLLSNLGLVGTLLFAGFLSEVLRRRAVPEHTPITEAARHAVLASLIAAAISCPVFDIGFCFYAFCAAATCAGAEQRASRPPLGARGAALYHSTAPHD